MADIEQGEKETAGKFLDRLWEALHKFTDIDFKFLTQSALDICRKLLKQVFGPNQSLEKLLQLAQTVYYGREYKKENKRQKRTRQKTEVPTMPVRPAVKLPEEKCPEGPR